MLIIHIIKIFNMSQNINSKTIILAIALSLCFSIGSIGVYHYLFAKNYNPKDIENYALKVSNQKITSLLQSDRLQKSFRSSAPTDFIYASQQSTPAVVYIEAATQEENQFWTNKKASSTGSGVIISEDGYIVTNNHVIANSNTVQVLLNDNREYSAKVIGTDPTTDLALVKIEEQGLPFVIFGNSDSLQIGEWVLAVGNPFRLQSTVTAGIVSAKARNIQILNNQNYSIESFIQTDAAVNPGNSGGALVNTVGELIGINTAIMTYSGRYEGYSFSIPSNLVRKVVMDLKEFGVVQRGLLGVVIENLTNESAKEMGLSKISGVHVTAINQGGAASDAGLKVDDVILEVNGRTVNSVPELQEIIGRFRPGNTINISYWRNKTKNQTKVTLRNQVNTTELITTRKDKILTDLGFELRDLTEQEKAQIGSFGIRVISIYENSTIALTNMAPNFIITSINKKSVNNVDQLIKLINETSGKITLEGIYEKYKGRYPYTFTKD